MMKKKKKNKNTPLSILIFLCFILVALLSSSHHARDQIKTWVHTKKTGERSLASMGNTPTASHQAVIIIRHAQDKDVKTLPVSEWQKPADQPIIKDLPDGALINGVLPKSKTVNYLQFRLTPEGLQAAERFASIIPKLLEDENEFGFKFKKLSHAIVKDPRPLEHTTSTPFETAYPLIIAERIRNIGLEMNPSRLSRYTTDQIEGSLLICWDVEGLWSKKLSNNQRELHPVPDSILEIENRKFNIPNDRILGPPKTGVSIYLYSMNNGIGQLRVFNMDQSNRGYTKVWQYPF